MDIVTLLAPSMLAVVLLAGIAVAVFVAVGVERPWAPASAVVRGVAQLAVLSAILTGVVTEPRWVTLALLVMFSVATIVAARRSGFCARTVATTAAAMAAGVVLSLGVVFGTGALDLTPRYALAIGAIVIGGSMTVATLTSRRLMQSFADHWDEVEGWLALGATPRQSTRDLVRRAVRDALIPALDQTRTTGLVVLPGAFVGAIFGGVSPMEAGRFQVVVLAAMLAAGAVTSALLGVWRGDVGTRPEQP